MLFGLNISWKIWKWIDQHSEWRSFDANGFPHAIERLLIDNKEDSIASESYKSMLCHLATAPSGSDAHSLVKMMHMWLSNASKSSCMSHAIGGQLGSHDYRNLISWMKSRLDAVNSPCPTLTVEGRKNGHGDYNRTTCSCQAGWNGLIILMKRCWMSYGRDEEENGFLPVVQMQSFWLSARWEVISSLGKKEEGWIRVLQLDVTTWTFILLHLFGSLLCSVFITNSVKYT